MSEFQVEAAYTDASSHTQRTCDPLREELLGKEELTATLAPVIPVTLSIRSTEESCPDGYPYGWFVMAPAGCRLRPVVVKAMNRCTSRSSKSTTRVADARGRVTAPAGDGAKTFPTQRASRVHPPYSFVVPNPVSHSTRTAYLLSQLRPTRNVRRIPDGMCESGQRSSIGNPSHNHPPHLFTRIARNSRRISYAY